MQPVQYSILFAVFAFFLGAAIGSFLNVCIYRMPLNLSVNNPRRSFCPKCQYQIPWWNNIPLISWLALRGKCANCGAPIAFRYFGVELLTGLLFLAIWLKVYPGGPHEWALAFPYWIMASLFVVATFIDFEHFIIPDEITWGGAAAGVLLSIAIPSLQGETSHFFGGLWSIIGAAAGYALLWIVVELGKKAFGKKAYAIQEPVDFSWIRRPVKTPEGGDESDADLIVGDISWKELPRPSWGERMKESWLDILRAFRLVRSKPPLRGEKWIWSETFGRESDRLLMKCMHAEVDGEALGEAMLDFTYNVLYVGDRKWELEKVDVIKGKVSSLIIPREAMGLGDVKFMACIGAFLGWKAILFTVMAASIFGSVIGVGSILVGHREWSAKIPFGPYLALGALLWLFCGPEMVQWYLQFVAGPREGLEQ